MEKSFEQYIISPRATMLEALRAIDGNKKGFLIVADAEGKVLGTLTDGDIRRAFIKGASFTTVVDEAYRDSFKYLTEEDGISEAIEMFKNSAIKFIPVLGGKGGLANIITKSQLHSLLLQDISADMGYDFSELDENVVDYEIFPRPWGFYKTTVLNDYFQSKIISVNPKGVLSLQSHNHREEHWIVAHGSGIAQIGESVIEIRCGSSLFIPKGCIHRLVNTDDKESLIITEVQIGDYLGEDDIIRYEDKYGRV